MQFFLVCLLEFKKLFSSSSFLVYAIEKLWVENYSQLCALTKKKTLQSEQTPWRLQTIFISFVLLSLFSPISQHGTSKVSILVIIADRNSFRFNDCAIEISLSIELHFIPFHRIFFLLSYFPFYVTRLNCFWKAFLSFLSSLYSAFTFKPPLKIPFATSIMTCFILVAMNICHSNAHFHKELFSSSFICFVKSH